MAYLTHTEATTLIAALLPSADLMRVTWEALSSADKAVCIEQAGGDIDAVRTWRGAVVVSDQAHLWPRYDTRTQLLVGQPLGEGYAISDVPTAILKAVALQAAHRAMQAAGHDANAELADAARMGVSATSAPGGGSVSLDLARAAMSHAALCDKAMRFAGPLMTAGADT